MKRIARIIVSERGATSIEYAAIASLVSVVAIAAIGTVGTGVTSLFAAVPAF